MFTGLIKEIGKIKSAKKRRSGLGVSIAAPLVSGELKTGDSVAVDGVCLTVEELTPGGFSAYVSSETVGKTTLSFMKKGDEVNIEPSLKAGDPFGGHFVQGHAEETGKVTSIVIKDEEAFLKIRVPSALLDAVAEKGSIAVSGVSLTIAEISGSVMTVAVVPHTLRSTTLKGLKPSSLVNLETDIIARQVIAHLKKRKGLTIRKLTEEGF